MLTLLLSFLSGLMVSVTPWTVLIGILLSWFIDRKYHTSTTVCGNVSFAIGEIIGVVIGFAGIGEAYSNQWRYLWWVPVLLFLASLVGILKGTLNRDPEHP